MALEKKSALKVAREIDDYRSLYDVQKGFTQVFQKNEDDEVLNRDLVNAYFEEKKDKEYILNIYSIGESLKDLLIFADYEESFAKRVRNEVVRKAKILVLMSRNNKGNPIGNWFFNSGKEKESEEPPKVNIIQQKTEEV